MKILKRICRFVALPGADKLLVLYALTLVVTVRLGIWLMPAGTIRYILSRTREETFPGGNTGISRERIKFALDSASRCIHGSSCLVRALAAHVLYARYGYNTGFRIGVKKDDTGELKAHAWISPEDIDVEESEIEGFTELHPFCGADTELKDLPGNTS